MARVDITAIADVMATEGVGSADSHSDALCSLEQNVQGIKVAACTANSFSSPEPGPLASSLVCAILCSNQDSSMGQET